MNALILLFFSKDLPWTDYATFLFPLAFLMTKFSSID